MKKSKYNAKQETFTAQSIAITTHINSTLCIGVKIIEIINIINDDNTIPNVNTANFDTS